MCVRVYSVTYRMCKCVHEQRIAATLTIHSSVAWHCMQHYYGNVQGVVVNNSE
jgi:hypothetical protein